MGRRPEGERATTTDVGKWSLVKPVGPSWVVLESSLRALYELPWFEDFVVQLSENLAWRRNAASVVRTVLGASRLSYRTWLCPGLVPSPSRR